MELALVNQCLFHFFKWRYTQTATNSKPHENELSVIIVTYNRGPDLQDCLDSLFNMNKTPSEVIIIDSNSTDCTLKVAKSYPVIFLSIKERSMLKARNVGLQNATKNIVAYIDDDVIVSKNWSEHILELYSNEHIGGVGGRVLPLGSNETLTDIPKKYKTVGKVFENGFVSNNYDAAIQNQIEVDTLIGCNMSFRKNLLIKAGGFDENFRGSCFRDDTDASTRVKRLNYKLTYNPKALVWHKYKGKKVNRKWFYWYSYNHFYFCFKNFQPVNITKFLNLLKGAFVPPRGYLRKTGISLKPDPLAAACIISGIIDANKVYKLTYFKKGDSD